MQRHRLALVVSRAALDRVVQHASSVEPRVIALAGTSDTIEIAAFKDRSDFERVLAS
jgi:hypothetical protein